jgi:hypothetical protein
MFSSTAVTRMRDACALSARRVLWRCPKYGRGFVGKNMWHACGNYSVEGFLDGKGTRARDLVEGFERLIAACGPYEVAPAKTRVAFMARVRFAGVDTLSDKGDDRRVRAAAAGIMEFTSTHFTTDEPVR